ncbi:DedA family protein [Micromonospora sp. NPDC051296]|uniref:DedA family protein n=1 Tax=Micromonospora sp. NPDC051296 TaxID=3155046 RepID=UPI003446F1E9
MINRYVAQAAPEDGIAGWAVDLMERIGGPGAGIAVALENLFPPLPSEVILPLAGFAASRGDFGLASALFWTTLGSVVGALALYWIGAAVGLRRVRAIAERMPLVNAEDIDRCQAWFDKHGSKAVFFGRMIPIFRSLISVPAGVARMPLGRFLVYTTLGSLIWNSIFVLSGYALGENWERVEGYAGSFQKIVILAVLVAVAVFVVVRLRRRNEARTAR